MEDDKKTQAPEMTIKQRKWVKAYLETGNATEAAMQAYDCQDRFSAAHIGWENLKKLDFAELMEEGGLTDVHLHKKLKEGLEATKFVLINTSQGITTLPDGKKKGAIKVADYSTRHKYLETALTLKKRLVKLADVTSDGKEIAAGPMVIVNTAAPQEMALDVDKFKAVPK